MNLVNFFKFYCYVGVLYDKEYNRTIIHNINDKVLSSKARSCNRS